MENDLMNRRGFLMAAAVLAFTMGAGMPLPRSSSVLADIGSAPADVSLKPRRSFTFLHTYESTGRYWKGITKAGLIRRTTGVRFVNSPFGDDDSRRLNVVGRIGGELHAIISERRCPLIVDRVAGGSPYCAYEFDQELIAAFEAMLGRNFLGGQIHETIGNTHNDWGRLVKADHRFASQPVSQDAVLGYFTWDRSDRWLEYGVLDEYVGRIHPPDDRAWWREIERNARRQAARFGHKFSHAEGSHWGRLAWHVFFKWGATSCFAEVGPSASVQSQFFIGSLRGAAKAVGKPWGVYFAPWGPEGATSFIPEKDWSWNCPRKILDASSWPVGPQFGCSSAMQRRIFFHAYLSGAHTLHEEWGAECNLTDWDTGTLSSYGMVTRDLLDFQEAFPDVGEPFTPIALVHDARIPPPDASLWDKIVEGLYQYGPADHANASRKNNGRAEVACYAPSLVPEMFDVIPSDAPKELWTSYSEIIKVDRPANSASSGSTPSSSVIDRLVAAVDRLSPMARSSHMPMQINRRAADNAWIIALYNPWGAIRGDVYGQGSVFNAECGQSDVLRAKFAIKSVRVLHAWPADSGLKTNGDEIHVTVGPGGTLILEVLPK